MNRLHAIVLLALALGSACAGAAEPVRRAAAHQHSVAQGQLAIDQDRLDLMLVIPGANLVGFEHPPRNPDQQARLDRAVKRLQTEPWMTLPPRADCSPQIRIEQPGFEPTEAAVTGEMRSEPDPEDSQIHDGHDHRDGNHDDYRHDNRHDDSDHDHHPEHEDSASHAEFLVTASASCARPSALEWIEIDLFTGWPDNRSLRIDALSEHRQWRAELSAGQTRMELR